MLFTLTAPDGSSIVLIQNDDNTFEGNMNFVICFVKCSETPVPDPGHNPVFTTDDGWLSDSDYSGTYHPFGGCLEDLTGSVNGDWTLEIEDTYLLDETDLNNWYLVFDDDDGIGCAHANECGATICQANAGNISITNSPACPSETITTVSYTHLTLPTKA